MTTLTGVVSDNGAAVGNRIVRFYRRDTGALLGQTITSDGVSSPADPYFPNVSFLCEFDGVRYAQAAVDLSPNQKTMTFQGGGRLDTIAKKYGNTGLYVDPGSGVIVTSHVDFALPGDFSFEIWFFLRSFNVLQTLFNIGSYASGWLLRLNSTEFDCYMNGGRYPLPLNLPLNQFNFLRISRSSGVLYHELNGLLLGTVNYAEAIPQGALTIGVSQHSTGEYLNGYIGSIRLTKGVSRVGDPVPIGKFPTSTNGVAALPVGEYAFITSHTGEVQVVVLDDDEGVIRQDKIARVTPL